MIYQIIQIAISPHSTNDGLVTSNFYQNSIWFWIALLELILILMLIVKINRKSKKLPFSDLSRSKLKQSQKASIDMDNVMNSINGSRELYKDLSKLCHPDKFINTEYHGQAVEIFKEISKHKRNYSKLSNLKERATKELNINL